MTANTNPTRRPTPPALGELFARYLDDQRAAHTMGLGFPESTGEVVPHEAAPVQPVDPALAWTDAVAAAGCFAKTTEESLPTPPEWPTLVGSQEPAFDLTFSLGNFPQLVRNLHPLLVGADLNELRTGPSRVAPPAGLVSWAKGAEKPPQALLAAGILRLIGQLDDAAAILKRPVAAEWKAMHANEQAALAWRASRGEEAAASWAKQPDSVPVFFNRGMAALFLGRAADARTNLKRAVEGLPETSAWYHLAALYLALATGRG
jgi:tetratricopeptide (TPR) repeat protein